MNRCFRDLADETEEEEAERIELLKAYNAVAMENEDITNFKESVEKSALEMICKLNSIMMLPRALVYNTIADFETFLKTVIDGMTLCFRILVVEDES